MTQLKNRTILPIIWLSFLLVLVTACSTDTQKSTTSAEKEVTATPQILSDDPSLSAWAQLIRGALTDYTAVYVEKPVFLGGSGHLGLPMEEQIRNHQIRYADLASLQTHQRVSAREELGYHYELGSFTNARGLEFKHLLILKEEGDTMRRELEFIARAAPTDSTIQQAIDKRRAEWIRLCNAHNAAELVKELYSANAMYYNHKPLVIGHDAIIEDYQYMNEEKYSLTLTPIAVELVTNRLAYEIGQCSGSYGGKYMLVWQKDKTGQWSIVMDSNI
mgnify:FL=1